MEIIINSERDRRTLQWLIAQVGDEAVKDACLQLAGERKPYVSNVAKLLGLVPPDSVEQPSNTEARARLVALKALIKSSRQ